MEVIIDRFEGKNAIVELPDKSFAEIERILLPEATEGNVIEIKINRGKTESTAKEIKKLMDAVWDD